jgi:hypothetical protein
MNELALSITPGVGAKAWRFTFERLETGQLAGTFIREPHPVVATAHPMELDAALDDPVDDASLSVIWLPTGNPTPADLEKSVALWIDQGDLQVPAVRANIRTSRVIWAGSRALVYAAPDQSPDALDAVTRFTLMARDTSALERQMKSIWSAVENHASLSHAVTFREQRLQPRISEMTETVTRMRISYLQIQSALEQTDPGLSSVSKRLCAELVLQAGLYDRLDVIDEPTQFALDHYELANTRLIEHKHASVEFFLTGLIVIALFVQTVVILVQELVK